VCAAATGMSLRATCRLIDPVLFWSRGGRPGRPITHRRVRQGTACRHRLAAPDLRAGQILHLQGRELAPHGLSTPAAMPMAGTPNSPRYPPPTPTRCPTAIPTPNSPRCCVPASPDGKPWSSPSPLRIRRQHLPDRPDRPSEGGTVHVITRSRRPMSLPSHWAPRRSFRSRRLTNATGCPLMHDRIVRRISQQADQFGARD
jgi:hypothetical protein